MVHKMQSMEVPFAGYIGIEQHNEKTLMLRHHETVENHLQTIHAGALYTLAESQSGLFLQRLFPALEGKVIPLLREGSMKYKRALKDAVYAVADVSDEVLEKFEMMFAKKGRGSITVSVLLKDEAGHVCAEGTFGWFVQKMEENLIDG